jgi:predicted Zn finger-like uncharacterized protein
MLIVCPSCATSYQIDPTSVGSAGRMVRCARCKTTWFAGAPANPVDAFVNDVIAEAEAEQKGVLRPDTLPPASNLDFSIGQNAPPSAGEPPPGFAPAPDFTAPLPEPSPVAISDAPSLVPPIEHVAYREPSPVDQEEELETFTARRKRMQAKRKETRRSSRWTAIILVLFAVNVALVGARNEVVRFLPQTASLFAAIGLPVNLRQLAFENVRIARETQDGATILMIEGQIVSTANTPVEVPRLRFAARNTAGQEIYTWTVKPDRSILEPGQRLPFSSRLASPPADANDVMVRFFTANDAMAGKK